MKRKTNVGNEEEPERCVGEDEAKKKQTSCDNKKHLLLVLWNTGV